jgi:hypothetical protein
MGRSYSGIRAGHRADYAGTNLALERDWLAMHDSGTSCGSHRLMQRYSPVGGRGVRVHPAMFCCGWLSDWRSRSICVLRLSGNSRSISNAARSPSPISRTIARLCAWSMSMEFRMMAFSLRKKPLVPGITVERPFQFCRRSNGDRRLWLSCASACVLE